MAEVEPQRPADLPAFLRSLLMAHSRTGIETISDGDRITVDCGLDSMALLETVLDLEQRLGITIREERMPQLVELSFAEFVDFVRRELDRPAENP